MTRTLASVLAACGGPDKVDKSATIREKLRGNGPD